MLWIRRNTVLVIVLVANLVLTAMMVEQAQIIRAQRELIVLLFGDSQQLAARKIEDAREQQRLRQLRNPDPPHATR